MYIQIVNDTQNLWLILRVWYIFMNKSLILILSIVPTVEWEKKDKLTSIYLLSASHRSCLTDALKDCEESCMDFFHATFSPIHITRIHLYVVWQKETFARLSCHSTVTFNGSISWLVLFIFLFLFVYCFPTLLSANQC